MGRTATGATLALGLTWLCLAAAAETPSLAPDGAAQGRLQGVAVLQVDGRAVCTAILIAPDEATTAGHCVADRATGDMADPAALTLVFRPLGADPVLRQVQALAVPPAYRSDQPILSLGDLAPDLALLSLVPAPDQPAITPLAPEAWPNPMGAFVDIAGFEREGAPGLRLREGCMVIEAEAGVAVATCDVVAGLSGAAVLLQDRPDDPPRLVASVSSRGQGAAFVVEIAPWLSSLRQDLAD